MKKISFFLSLTAALTSYSSAFVLINENFDSATVGDTSVGANGDLAGTTLRTRNNPGSAAMEALTIVTSGSVPGFTSASGNVVQLSISAGNTSAAFSASPAVFTLPGPGVFDASATYTISFDLYIPDDGAVPGALLPGAGIGRAQARLSGATGNGPTLSSQSQTAPGVFAISYTGTLGADFGQGATPSTTAEPFFSFSQTSGSLEDDQVAFIDNVFFEIVPTPVPEPSTTILLGLGALAFLRRRR